MQLAKCLTHTAYMMVPVIIRCKFFKDTVKERR